MSSQQYANRFARALESTGIFQMVDTKFTPRMVSILGRVIWGEGSTKEESERELKQIIGRLLEAEVAVDKAAGAWVGHYCQRYLKKGKATVYGWCFAIESDDMRAALDRATAAVRKTGDAVPDAALSPVRELTEFPLPGLEGNVDRNVPLRGRASRGAHTIGGQK